MKKIMKRILKPCIVLQIALLFSLTIWSSSTALGQNSIDLNSLPDVETYTVVRTNPTADTVIIALHGGPTDMLYSGQFEFFEGIPTFSVVEMEQYTHQHTEIFSDFSMTLEEAIVYNDSTIALLKKVVNHYNDLDKEVVLLGHSLGAFILSEYLDDYGNEDLHRIIPMAGRLNMNDQIWNTFADGFHAEFSEDDGLTIIFEPEINDPSEWANRQLKAGIAYNRWVDSLATLDLTNLMYVYAEYDVPVGRLLDDELDMLAATGASVLMVPQGGHSSMFELQYMNQVLGFIRENSVVSVSETILVEADVNMYPTIINNNLIVDSKKNGVIRISSIGGQLVFEKSLQSGVNDLTLNNLISGIYVASYMTIDNEWKSQKLIVK